MRIVFALFLLALVGSTPLLPAKAAEPTTASMDLLTDPIWMARPPDTDIWKFYPERAFWEGVSGFAIVSCTVTNLGQLEGCKVYGEEPQRKGFGTALAKLASFMMAGKISASGVSTVGRTIRLGAKFTRLQLDRNLFVRDESPYKATFRAKSVTIELVTVQQ